MTRLFEQNESTNVAIDYFSYCIWKKEDGATQTVEGNIKLNAFESRK